MRSLTRAAVVLRRSCRSAPLCTAASRFPPPPAAVPPDEMTSALKRRIASLEGLHIRFEQMEEDYHERLRKFEAEYMGEVRQLFDRRQQIVSGADEPTEEEVEASSYLEVIKEAEAIWAAEGKAEPAEVTGVPAFWSSIVRSCDALHTIENFSLSEADLAVLDYLVDVQQRPWDEKELAAEMGMEEGWDMGGDPGFSLHLTFAPNPHLENAELALYCSGEFQVLRTTTPVWRDEKSDPTVRWLTKKVKSKGGQTSRKTVAKPADSFFRIFEVASGGDDEDGFDERSLSAGAEPEGALPLEQLQSEIVLRLREDVVPRAGIHFISALHGEDDGEDGMGFHDDDDGWEEGPAPLPPPRGGRR